MSLWLKLLIMIKISVVFSFLMLLALQTQAVSVITGTWSRKGNEVNLYVVENGMLRQIAMSVLSNGGKFGFALNNDSQGFYVLGSQAGSSPADKYTFYLKPGDNVNIEVNDSTYVFAGENTPENKEMQRWHDLILPLELRVFYLKRSDYIYTDFFSLLRKKLEDVNCFKTISSVDAGFEAAFIKHREFDLANIVTDFLQTLYATHIQAESCSEFIGSITIRRLTETADILNYPYGMMLIRKVQIYTALRHSAQIPAEKRKEQLNLLMSPEKILSDITDNLVKGEVMLQQASFMRSYAELYDFEKLYGQYLITESQRQRMKALLASIAENLGGEDAVGFTFRDVNGKPVSLSGFKGKAVYVDVWATWCMPCRAEIPHLKKLEAEYEGKNIVFLGVSIDKESDHGKWKNFLVNEQLPGVQLFAGEHKEDITRPYKITGIPRFMLFGKDGKVVTVNAPRPSSGEIRALLDSEL